MNASWFQSNSFLFSSWKCNQPHSDLTPRVKKFTWQKMLNVRDLPLENNLVGQSLSWQITHLSNLWAKNPPLEQTTWCSYRTNLNSTVCQKLATSHLVVKRIHISTHCTELNIHHCFGEWTQSILVDCRITMICCLKWIEFRWLVWDLFFYLNNRKNVENLLTPICVKTLIQKCSEGTTVGRQGNIFYICFWFFYRQGRASRD